MSVKDMALFSLVENSTLATDVSEVKHKISYTSSGKENLSVTMTNQEIDDAIDGFRKMKKKLTRSEVCQWMIS